MSRQVTGEELEEHLRERLDEVRHGQSLRIVDGATTIGTIEPAQRVLNVIRHDPALRLQDFRPGRKTDRPTDAVDWLIAERDRERTGTKHGGS